MSRGLNVLENFSRAKRVCVFFNTGQTQVWLRQRTGLQSDYNNHTAVWNKNPNKAVREGSLK